MATKRDKIFDLLEQIDDDSRILHAAAEPTPEVKTAFGNLQLTLLQIASRL